LCRAADWEVKKTLGYHVEELPADDGIADYNNAGSLRDGKE
jgi:hypothetical protein